MPAPRSNLDRARPLLAAIERRTRATRLGARQARILAHVREIVAAGEPFPELTEIRDYLGGGQISDIEGSLLGLAARGLLVATGRAPTARASRPAGWRITPAGWEHR